MRNTAFWSLRSLFLMIMNAWKIKILLFLFIELEVAAAIDIGVVVFVVEVWFVLFLSFSDRVMHSIYSLVKWVVVLLSWVSLSLTSSIRQCVDHFRKFNYMPVDWVLYLFNFLTFSLISILCHCKNKKFLIRVTKTTTRALSSWKSRISRTIGSDTATTRLVTVSRLDFFCL